MRKLFGLLVVGLMIVVVAGCGATDTLAEVEERGYIEFAMSGGYPPFNYYNDAGELVGFDVEIAAEVAERLGVESRPVTNDFDGLVGGLQAGNFDGILGSMAITPERLEAVDFSDPYYYSGAQLVVATDSSIEDVSDITEDMRIGVVTGTTFADQVNEWGAEAVYYDSDALTLQELNVGNVDGVITDRLVALINADERGFDIRMVGDYLYLEECAVAVRQGDDDLREAINQALEDMRADGTYQEISERYFGEDIGVK
ncbi:MAG: transporter substrate-binding domain-containing protein [Firmicutes bacterium]|nr:transporter substrate-binding domain-containing protein [Bacillota bacterium]